MTADEFYDQLAQRMRCARIDIRSLGIKIEPSTQQSYSRGTWTDAPCNCVAFPATQLMQSAAYKFAHCNEHHLKEVARWVRNWHAAILWEQSMLGAQAFLGGVGGLPYLVDAVADRMLALACVSWKEFASAVAPTFEWATQIPAPGMYDSYTETYRRSIANRSQLPADFGRIPFYRDCAVIGGALLELKPIMGVVAEKLGRNLRLDILVAPGVIWRSGPAPAVYLLDASFPTAICHAAKGMQLCDVVKDPMFDVPGLTIRSMRHDGVRTVIEVADVRVDASTKALYALPLAA